MRNFVIQLTESNRDDLMRLFSCKVKFYNFEKYGSFYGYVENRFGCFSVAEIENTPIVDIENARKLMSTNAIIAKTTADLVRLKFERKQIDRLLDIESTIADWQKITGKSEIEVKELIKSIKPQYMEDARQYFLKNGFMPNRNSLIYYNN